MTISKIDLRNLTFEELRDWITILGLEPYRAEQVYRWIFQPNIRSFDQMTNLSKKWRSLFEDRAYLSRLIIKKMERSADGTRKFLFQLEDGELIESVLIPERGHFTLCISSQVGCAQRCSFCFTGRMGLKRNLKASEIVNQVLAVQETLNDKEALLTNIVLMGMGEPLHNFVNTVRALKTLLSPEGMQFSHRHVTLSTAGLIPKMKALGQALPVNLAVSLNAADDATRNRLMPINLKYPLEALVQACREFPLPHGKRITFEYILIKGANDSPQAARTLAKLLKGVKAKINLIPFNAHPGIGFEPPEEKDLLKFQDILIQARYTAIIRRSKGADISAACGQLHADWTRPS
ncbi:MAG: 23S rRNA (adenine(2503)-C(2))-methyltransferase RlmN [Deltaproteobacteria bacterium]|nr:23S rRNA (adenine(2503)-C(2))-methyltransferase RlmN [Deltaproteobacteria bacterium]